MAFTEGASEGSLNGTSEVTIVSAPASSTRRVIRSIVIHNLDTVAVALLIRKKVAASYYAIDNPTLDPGDTWSFSDDVLILDATNESIVAELGGAITSDNPDFNAAYADVS